MVRHYQVKLPADEWITRNAHEDVFSKHTLLIVPRGSILQFIIDAGSNILGLNPVFYCNYPTEKHLFDRNTFYQYKG